MANLTIPYYKLKKPQKDEVVMVTFTEHLADSAECIIPEYPNCKGFLSFNDVKQKKHMTNWHKVIPLNKEMIARVEDNKFSHNMVQISLVYINNKSDTNFEEYFIRNKTLISCFKKLSYISSVDIDELWSNIVYEIDALRRSDYDVDDMPCLLNYCNDELENIKYLFDDYDNLYTSFVEFINSIYKEKPYKIISHIEIISNGSVSNTISLLKSRLEKLDFDYTMKYMSTPIFLFESKSIDSTIEHHTDFIKNLIDCGNNFEPKIFIRCNQTEKIEL